MQKIKILFLIDELSIGGTETQLLFLTEHLSRDLFDPVIGVLYETPYQNTLNIKTPIVSFNWSGAPILKNIILIKKINKFLRREKIDVLQTHFVDSTIYGAWAVRLCRNRPYLITTRRNLYHWVNEEPFAIRFLKPTVQWTDRVLVNSYRVFEESRKREAIPPEKIKIIPNAIEVERFGRISSDEAKK